MNGITDKTEPFRLRKRAGYESTAVSIDAAATGVTITVAANATAITFNTKTSLAIVAEMKACTSAAADVYPIEAEVGDAPLGEVWTADDIINDASKTLETGVWVHLHNDTSGSLWSARRIKGVPGQPLLLKQVGGTFTGSGTDNTTLTVWEEDLTKAESTCIYTEIISAAAVTTAQLDNTFNGNEGLPLKAGMDYVVRIARGTNLSLCDFAIVLTPDRR